MSRPIRVRARGRSLVALLTSAALVVGVTAAVDAPASASPSSARSVAASAPTASSGLSQQASSDDSTVVVSRPDLVSARIAARSQGSPVEVTSLDDEYSTTFVNPDGSLTSNTSVDPLRVLRDGVWVPVDYDLQLIGGVLSPKASPVPVSFSDGGTGPAAAIGSGAKLVDQSWDGSLPTPSVSGATASYDLGDGESLVLTATARGYDQSVVLAHAPTSLSVIRLPFASDGLTLTSAGAGSYAFVDAAGAAVYQVPAPTMFDSSVDPITQLPFSQLVPTTLTSGPDGAELDLSPSLAWLATPGLQYPVTIDPTVMKNDGADEFIADNSTNNWSSPWLRVGYYVGHFARSYMGFNTGQLTQFAGKDITNATLDLWDIDADSCGAQVIHAYPLTQNVGDSNSWSNLPTYNSSATWAGSASFAHGHSTNCPDAAATIDVTNMVNGWVNQGLLNDGLQLSGNETTSSQGWEFCSNNSTSGTNCDLARQFPQLSITYSSYPPAPASSSLAAFPCASDCSGTGSNTAITDSTTPNLNDVVSDADGGTLSDQWQVFSGTIANPGTTAVASGTTTVSSGGSGVWTVPSGALSNGGSYVFRARGVNGPAAGAWSSYFAFQVDTTPPVAPTLTSSQFSAGQWNNPTSGTISVSSSADVAQYDWRTYSAAGVVQGATGSFNLSGLASGSNTISVLAIDKAGNQSASTTETIGVGAPAIASPNENDNTQKNVTVSSPGSGGGLSMPAYVTYEWRYGSTGSFAPIPTNDLSPLGTAAAVSSWPISSTGAYTWNVAHTSTVAETGGSSSQNPGDGNIQIEGCYGSSASTVSTTCQTTPVDVAVDADAFQGADATEQIGPGTLADLTGDYKVAATDVSAFGESLSRSLTTLAPSTAGTSTNPATASSDLSAVFGPGWTASLAGPSDSAASETINYQPTSGLVTLTGPDGSQTDFTDPSTANGVTTYTDPDDDTQTITYNGAGQGQLSYSDDEGGNPTITEWVPGTGPAWQPSAVIENNATAQNTADYFYYPSTNPYAGMLQAITTPSAANINCSTLANATSVEGCRTMELNYTTLSGGSDNGQVRLSEVDMALWNPAASTPATATTAVADYSYNGNGQLIAEWDPRISPALKTTYTYDANGRLSTLTPPGLATWTFGYNAGGQLITVSRPDPSGTTAVSTIVYGLPLTGSGLPDVSSDSSGPASWGQTSDLPVAGSGTAVFPPSYQPASTTLSGVASSDWPHAAITYMDVDGQDVDDAAYSDNAWQIASTQYDSFGNTVWSLDPENRNEALNPASSTDPYVAAQTSSSTRANLLASTSTFSGSGNEDLSDLGPMHPVTITANGQQTVVDARAHIVRCFDDSATACTSETVPSSAAPGLVMTTTASVLDAGGNTDNAQTTTNSYEPVDGGASGWTLGQPTAVTDPGGLTTSTGYNADGTTAEVDQPSTSTSAGARSQLTTYYTAPASGSGDNVAGCIDAAWVKQVCRTSYNSTSAELPVTSYTYDMSGNQLIKTETYGTGSGAVSRTTAMTYDAAGRELTSSVTVSPDSASGTDIPAVTYGYDPNTGLQTSTSTGSGSSTTSLNTSYDSFGRVESYTDSTGNVSITHYNLDGHLASRSDGKATTTYSYGPDSGDQNQLTSENIGVGGAPSTFAATYNADGSLTSQTYPNGLVATSQYDNVGKLTGLVYTIGGTSWMSFTQNFNAHAQIVTQSSPESSQAFTYDGSDRLAQVQDTDNSSGTSLCSTRQYSYDNDSNRSKLLAYPDSGSGCSTSTTPTETDYQYDAADRLTSDTAGSYSYDALGRTLTVPAADAQGAATHAQDTGTLSIGYYANDMVASQSQGSDTITFSLDPDQNRIATSTDGGTTTVNHFSDDSDSPTWTQTGSSAWSRNSIAPNGDLAAITNQSGAVELQLSDPHGDIIATCADATTATGTDSYTENTEFGAPRNSTTANTTYGWLGGKTRSSNDLGGLTLMGARLYDAQTARFLSVDPINGGNANSYVYPADPINSVDLSGCAGIDEVEGVGGEFDGESDPSYGGYGGGIEEGGGDDVGTRSSGQRSNDLGQAGEAAVRREYDIGVKKRTFIRGRWRIPDGQNDDSISEVKNARYVYFSLQLRDDLWYAEQRKNFTFYLYVRSNTTLSGPLLQAILDPDLPIELRDIPGT